MMIIMSQQCLNLMKKTMKPLLFSYQWVLLACFSTSLYMSAAEYKVSHYDQTLDHFNYDPESNVKFQQRFVVNSKYWLDEVDGEPKSPIFAYLVAEGSVDDTNGMLIEKAIHFNALLVYIEHRYYGESIPFSSPEIAFEDAETLGYLSSAQAMEDYAEIIIHIKKEYNAEESPVIVFGASHGGSLAAWFRLKYPHIALGALASSAPLLYYDDITPHNGFATVVSNTFKEASRTCHDTIKRSWDEIDKLALVPHNRNLLIEMFNELCNGELTTVQEIKDYLKSIYVTASMHRWSLVIKMCTIIDYVESGEDIMDCIYDAAVTFKNELGDTSCVVNPSTGGDLNFAAKAWIWQTCSELVATVGQDTETMLESKPFDPNKYTIECRDRFGIDPRLHWITNYNGGHDIYLSLKIFGSNIIFSNGLKDPWSSGGVLKSISDTIVSITSVNGTHCQDISNHDDDDPDWLVDMRQKEIDIIKGWIATYYTDLKLL